MPGTRRILRAPPRPLPPPPYRGRRSQRHPVVRAVSPLRDHTVTRLGRHSGARRSIMILACVSGSPRASNAASTPSSPPTVPVSRGRAVDLAVGQHVQGVAEFQWGVTEYEAQVDFLADCHRGTQFILAHADADDHDARIQRGGRAHDAVDHAGGRRRIRRSPAAWALPHRVRRRPGRRETTPPEACAASPSNPCPVRRGPGGPW